MIKKNQTQKVEYGIMVGFQLGVLEYLSDTPEMAEEGEIEKTKKEILIMVESDDIKVDMTSCETIISSVVEGYKYIDLEFYSCILLGLCVERYMTSRFQDTTLKGKMLEALAEATMKDVPDSIIKNKDRVYLVLKLLCKRNVPLKEIAEIISEWIVKGKELNVGVNTEGYVFISYSSKNQEYAEAMRALLTEENIKNWMAPYDIPAGSKYAHVINDAIEKCSCVLLLLSEQSQASAYVEKEVERAIAYRKTIIPMHIDESSLNAGFKYYIGNEQIVSVRKIDKLSPEIQRIIRGIKGLLEKTSEGHIQWDKQLSMDTISQKDKKESVKDYSQVAQISDNKKNEEKQVVVSHSLKQESNTQKDFSFEEGVRKAKLASSHSLLQNESKKGEASKENIKESLNNPKPINVTSQIKNDKKDEMKVDNTQQVSTRKKTDNARKKEEKVKEKILFFGEYLKCLTFKKMEIVGLIIFSSILILLCFMVGKDGLPDPYDKKMIIITTLNCISTIAMHFLSKTFFMEDKEYIHQNIVEIVAGVVYAITGLITIGFAVYSCFVMKGSWLLILIIISQILGVFVGSVFPLGLSILLANIASILISIFECRFTPFGFELTIPAWIYILIILIPIYAMKIEAYTRKERKRNIILFILFSAMLGFGIFIKVFPMDLDFVGWEYIVRMPWIQFSAPFWLLHILYKIFDW